MNNRLITLILYLAFICLPIFLLSRDLDEQIALKRNEVVMQMRERATRRLEVISRGSRENQIENLFMSFREAIQGQQASNGDLPEPFELRKLHERLIKPYFPKHDLAIVHVQPTADGLKSDLRYACSAGLGFVSSQAPQDLASILVATEPLSPDLLTRFRHQMRAATHFPFPLVNQLNNRGRLQEFMGEEGNRAFFWDIISRPDSQEISLVMAIIDIDGLDELYPFRVMVSTWNDPEWGIGFLPLKPGKPLLSAFFRKEPRLAKRLRATALHRVHMGIIEIRQRTLLMIGSPLTDTPFRPVIACRLPEITPPTPGRDALLFATVSLFLALSLVITVERTLLDRGMRVPIAITLLATFSMVALLPITGANSIIRRASVEQIRKERDDIAERLHNYLNKIDKGVCLDQVRMIYRVRKLTGDPDVIAGLEREHQLEAAGLQPHFADSATLASLASQVTKSLCEAIDPGIIRRDRMNMNMIAAFGPEHSFTSWFGVDEGENATRAISHLQDKTAPGSMDATAKANTRRDLGIFLGFLCRPLLERFTGVDYSDASTENQSTKRNELMYDVMLENLLSILGQETIVNVLYQPNRFHEFKTTIERIIFLEVPMTIRGRGTYIAAMFWSLMIVDRAYLFRLLEHQRIDNSADATIDERIFAFNNQLRNFEHSIPPGLQKNLPLMELVTRANIAGIPLRGQTTYATDPTSIAGIQEALPSRYLTNFVLTGQRSMQAVYQEEEKRRKFLGWLIAIAFVLSGLIALAGAGHILRPLRAIQFAVAKIAANRFETSLDANREDEFGSVARAFNVMAQRLQEGRYLERYVSATVRRAVTDEGFSAAATHGETRSVTILFSSLSKFAAFTTGRSPSEIFVPLETHMKIMTKVIERHGGEIDKIMGEKILVVFDHELFGGAENAVSAAIAVIDDVRLQLQTFLPAHLKSAMGLNSGTVIAGIIGAQNVRLDYTVIGDPVNVAARLATLATDLKDGGALLSEETARWARGRVKPVGAKRVKGKTQEIQVFLLNG
ncbi:MAG: adenylate/guanylate cyclase domain-containing protein [Candidatus Riflebacteria bacterium]|nr:adenylate/guanylate cyclase domain-containing protein [Candidatus Riflebacteria bacterium]